MSVIREVKHGERSGFTRSTRSAPTVILHIEDGMKHSFTRAALTAVIALSPRVGVKNSVTGRDRVVPRPTTTNR